MLGVRVHAPGDGHSGTKDASESNEQDYEKAELRTESSHVLLQLVIVRAHDLFTVLIKAIFRGTARIKAEHTESLRDADQRSKTHHEGRELETHSHREAAADCVLGAVDVCPDINFLHSYYNL